MANSMTFTWRDQSTVYASGPIETGDAKEFTALRKFNTLELDSPGGLVDESLEMAANIDARGSIRTVVKPGSSCASACAMALFVSGETRIVYMGGRLGIHSCALSGTPVPECNEAMAANATAHGVPWSVIEGFADSTPPASMLWLDAEDAECWGLMKWNAGDGADSGIACFKYSLFTNQKRVPDEVTAKNANDIICRMNAGTSRIYISTGRTGQGFSDTYRNACERVAKDSKSPKYAVVDIVMWLMLTDPHILAIRPVALMRTIFNNDQDQVDHCWKCFTILGMSALLRGFPKDALAELQVASKLVQHDTGSVPMWLASRIDLATQANKAAPAQ